MLGEVYPATDRGPILTSMMVVTLIIAFVVLAVVYSLATPIFEAPDELQHFAHLDYVARNTALPPLGGPGEHLWAQQALQAPLYYWLAATVTCWVDASDLPQQAVLQPKANFGDATLPGKKNAFLHPSEQSFPYRNASLAVHLARWLSVLIGAGTVVLTFVAARFVCANDWLAFASAGLLAFIPQFLFISASVSNDPLVTLTSMFTLVVLLWIVRDGVDPRKAILLGLAIGLMALSKLVGTVLGLVAVAVFICCTRQLKSVAIVVGLSTILSGWWYVRNALVYGDPLAVRPFLRFMGRPFDIGPMQLEALWSGFRLLRFSTWGLFGHISVLMEPTWIYSVFDAVAAFGLIGLALAMIVLLRNIGLKNFIATHRLLLILVLWVATVLAAGARWFPAAGIQGRLIFAGLPAGMILIIYGWRFLLRQVPAWLLAVSLTTPLGAFSVFVIPAYILPAYSPLPLVGEVPAGVTPTAITFAHEIRLRGYTVSRDANLIRMTFYWETLERPSANYTVSMRLVEPDGSFWLDYVNYPGMGTTFPTTWQIGELRRDEYVFDLNRFHPADQPLRLIVGFFDPRTNMMTDFGNLPDGREPGWATLQDVYISRLDR